MDSFTFRKSALFALIGFATFTSALAAVREQPPVPTIVAPEYLAAGEERLYIVQLDEPPALAMHARESRLQTRSSNLNSPDAPARFNPKDGEVSRYVNKLKLRQDQVLRSINAVGGRVYSYSYTFNGVAVKLTPYQANKLRLRKDIANVWEDRQRKVSTSDSPEFLGLLNRNGGLRNDLKLQGEDVIIGVIDSGIAPNHPSFSDREQEADRDIPKLCRSTWAETSFLGRFLCRKYRGEGDVVIDPVPADWNGTCVGGEGFSSSACNNKLIGARYYVEGFQLANDLDVNEFVSPADADGHGTHIASIAAGNVVEAKIYDRNVGTISGMAPRARIAMYKACWISPGGTRASCSIADLQKAIEDAVADGVDIINYAIGDLNDSIDDPDDLALLAASDAGILSVTPSGNEGPTPFTILSPSTTPWVISVGASSRTGKRTAEGLRVNKPEAIADDYEDKEASFTPRLEDVGPITAEVALADDGEIATPEGAAGTVFDACSTLANSSEINNRIAMVQRGGCDFDDKLRIVQDAGAVAMLVFNNDAVLPIMAGSSTFAEIPAVIISQADGQLLRDRILDEELVEVTLDKSIFLTFRETGDIVGSFSGRGPSLGDPDFLKPDIIAPGVDILAGQAPQVANGFRGERFQYLSGTSQSVPHVAGLAALIKQAHPDWTPAEIKSALMTTARQDIVKEDRTTPADPFDMGSGHVVPNTAVDPGLLFDINSAEYDSYLCTIGLARVTPDECQALVDLGLELDARDLNLPSIAITELVGTTEVTRTVSNPGSATEFSAVVDAPAGITVEVTPAVLSLNTDETAEYTVSFSSDGSRMGEWLFGSVTWVDNTHRVYTPFAVNPSEIVFTDEVRTVGTPGSAQVDVRFGYDGNYGAIPLGLELPCVLPDNTPEDTICTNTGDAIIEADDPFNSYEFLAEPPAWVERFTLLVEPDNVGEFNTVLRIALFDQLTDGNDDLDLYLYYCDDADNNSNCENDEIEFVATSQNDQTSEELITELYPLSGTYFLDVHGYETDPLVGGDGAEFSVLAWALDSNSDAGNLSLADVPAGAAAGTGGTITVSWPVLADGLWLGGISHNNAPDTSLGITVIEVDNVVIPEP